MPFTCALLAAPAPLQPAAAPASGEVKAWLLPTGIVMCVDQGEPHTRGQHRQPQIVCKCGSLCMLKTVSRRCDLSAALFICQQAV